MSREKCLSPSPYITPLCVSLSLLLPEKTSDYHSKGSVLFSLEKFPSQLVRSKCVY